METGVDVLVVSPHPDDGEWRMGGTMIRLVDAGYSLMQVVLTQGEAGTHGDVASRKKELAAACEVIGCQHRMLDFIDTGIVNDRESRIRIALLLRELRPKIVFAPYHTNPLGEPRGSCHVDHAETGALVRDAIKLARLKKVEANVPAHTVQKLYFYMLPRTVWANLVVDISPVIERLREAFRAHTSQLAITAGDRKVEELLMQRRVVDGISIGVNYAEGFMSDQPLQLEADDLLRI